MKTILETCDTYILRQAKAWADPLSRWALFLVFFWFGLLKVLRISPAYGLVVELQVMTLPFIESGTFVVILGIVEMLIGLSFVIPSITRVAIFLLIAHMITTFLPLVFLPETAWQMPFVPTLEGQYIIKNVVLLALALQIGVRLIPLKDCKDGWFERIFKKR